VTTQDKFASMVHMFLL